MESVRHLLLQIRPRVIIHTASPTFYEDDGYGFVSYQVNVMGTQNLLEAAKTTKSVRAFVYTSSSMVHDGLHFRFITEEARLVDELSECEVHTATKALADRMVLQANCQELRTLCLRPPVIYGERDGHVIPDVLNMFNKQLSIFQLSDNSNYFDAIYVGNAARAHVLAAKALLKPHPPGLKVDGEAFFITDDAPIPFWDFQQRIWAAAGEKSPPAKRFILPSWLTRVFGGMTIFAYWVFSLGPPWPQKTLRPQVYRYSRIDRTFNIDKAKTRLGYMPLVDTNEGIRRGVDWALSRRHAGGVNKHS